MSKFKRYTLRIFLTFCILIPIAAFAHFFIFPQESRSILIDYSNFKKEGRVYFNVNTPSGKIDTLQAIIQKASLRVTNFWGKKKSDPTFIYCDNNEDFTKYGNAGLVPAVTHYKLGPYIVISNQGLDIDIIAHEISHAELYEQLGFYKMTFTIPRWFDEGLAMQNDYRDYYSEDTLKVKSGKYKNLPDIEKFKSAGAFYEGTAGQVMLNFMTAKHVLKGWYTREKLDKFIRDITSGKSFAEAFK